MPNNKPGTKQWPKWVGVFGGFLFFGGLAWLALWTYSQHDHPEFIDTFPPWPPQVMIFVGLVTMIVLASRMCVTLIRRRF